MQVKNLSKRNIIINVTVILAVTVLAFIYLTKSKIVTSESIKQVTWYNYLILFGVFLLSLILVSSVDFFIYRSFTRSMSFDKCFVNTLSGNLGSGITPFKSGHFPLMIYYQNRVGVPVGDTITGLIKCQIIYSATSIVVYVGVVLSLIITGATITFNNTTIALWLVVSLGLTFHIAVFVAIVILAFCQPLQNKALKIWTNFLFKIKKISDKESYILEKQFRLSIYKEQITIIGKSTYKYLLPCALYIVYMIFLGSVQYIAYLLISGASFSLNSLFVFYTLNLASSYITNIIPVPGGFGTSEFLFPLVFAYVIPDSLIGATLILWRVSTYYLAIIFEFIVFLFAMFIKCKKSA